MCRPCPIRECSVHLPLKVCTSPSAEHDACGVGFVVHIKGTRSHDIVEKALQVLVNLEHRGACGCEENTGDGAGILIQMPDAFLRTCAPATLPAAGEYGAGLVFLPHDESDRESRSRICIATHRRGGRAALHWLARRPDGQPPGRPERPCHAADLSAAVHRPDRTATTCPPKRGARSSSASCT